MTAAGRGTMSFLIIACTLSWHAQCAAEHHCGDLLPDGRKASANRRDVTTTDLVRLRDIGAPDSNEAEESPLGVSPDGHRLAFVIQRANPAENTYCRGLAVLSIDHPGRPRLLDVGGSIPRQTIPDLHGMVFPTGNVQVTQPQWSPDGQSIAYLKRAGRSTQAWVVRASDGTAFQASHAEGDIETVRWAAAGRLVVATRPALPREQRSIDREARTGWHYDAQVQPIAGPRPFPAGPPPLVESCIDLLRRPSPMQSCPTASGSTMALRGGPDQVAAVAIRPDDPEDYASPARLWLRDDGKPLAPCRSELCGGKILGAWAIAGSAYFLRRTGWADNEVTLYRLDAGRPPRSLLETGDVLTGCQPAPRALICARDAAAAPRRLVKIDLGNGAAEVLFDANPELGRLRLGKVQRLTWTFGDGVKAYADLVLPPSHVPGDRHPLVVVQYISRGFLRGGTGDEYPIFALAARGFAVLSFHRPPFYAELYPEGKYKDWIEAEALNVRDWNERRHLLRALLGSIDAAIATGTVDRTRIGLSGMSDGATTAQFALVNAHIFSAVALSNCCEDPGTFLSLAGPAVATEFGRQGWPGPATTDTAFWKGLSLSLNAPRVRAPILMQLPSDEYLLALESYDALRAAGKIVDMFVFDREHHVKDQPAHRLAIYDRSVRWFAYWLLDDRRCEANSTECRRWRDMSRRSVPLANAGDRVTLEPGG